MLLLLLLLSLSSSSLLLLSISISQAISGTSVSQERRGLLDYDVLDCNQNLICHSENIPLMFKGIAFIEESKSQPKRDGFDIERGLLGR